MSTDDIDRLSAVKAATEIHAGPLVESSALIRSLVLEMAVVNPAFTEADVPAYVADLLAAKAKGTANRESSTKPASELIGL